MVKLLTHNAITKKKAFVYKFIHAIIAVIKYACQYLRLNKKMSYLKKLLKSWF